ncbi:hypothetical protein RND81_08G124600 [Saponaria officinalis]|uniref:Cytochrome P450 n=1 Tax=Saponaria officinalis TaxID=3572 RepID=A0AAW1J6P8_SAPOF
MWTVALITFSFVIVIFFIFTRNKKPHPPLPPGPSSLPVFGNLLSLQPDLHSYFASLAQIHGPLFSLRLGSKLAVVISSPAVAAGVLRDNDAIFANRDVPAAALAATYGGADIVWTPLGPELRLLRKVCVREMLGPATLAALYGLRRREVRHAVKQIAGRVGTPVRVGEEMFLVAMNIITGMLWGGTVAEAAERETIGREFRATVAELTELLGTPNLSDFFPALGKLDLQGVVRKMKKVAKRFDDVFERVIEKRLRINDKDEKIERDFLEVLLKMKDEYERNGGENGVSFTMIHIKALLMDMVVGGTDTTSNTVEFAMAEIMNKPEVLNKVQEELDTVIGKDGVVEEHHIYKLPYLQAVMKETLRLHPTVPLLVPHCPSESCIVGGYTIPKGSRVFFNVWAIHRDPSIWANPLEFDPNRFVNAKFDFNGNDFTYFPFGSGRRICAGIGMAERMVFFSLASLLHSFDWKWPAGEERNVEEKFGIVLSKKIPLVLIPEPRLTDPALYE